MSEKICGIYKIENIVNSKVYIGQSIDILNCRWEYHKNALRNGYHYNRHLQNAWDKYGENSFNFSVIEECTPEELNQREVYYISHYQSYLPKYGYNGTMGGEGGVPTEEAKKKMSAAHLGIKGTPESRAKQSRALRGKNNPMYGKRGPLSPTFGRSKSEEEIQKLRDVWTDERRSEYSSRISGENNPMYGMSGSQNPFARGVVCLTTGDTFETMKLAAQWCGLTTYKNISDVCRGHRKHAGKHPDTGEKLSWAYINPEYLNATRSTSN